MATIDDWFDESTLMELVPIDVYVRGASAVEAGAVRIIERDGAQLLTSVEAGDGRRRGGVEPGRRAAHVRVHLRRRERAPLRAPHRLRARHVAGRGAGRGRVGSV